LMAKQRARDAKVASAREGSPCSASNDSQF
jgi:hypothetical protein